MSWVGSGRRRGSGSVRRSRRPTAAQAGAWRAISAGRHALVVAPTGSGKTLAAFLWSLDQLAARPAAGGREALPGAVCQPAEGPGGRRRAQPAGAAGRHPAGGRPARAGAARHQGRHAHRRHPGRRAAGVHQDPARHPDHHARVAVPAAHLAGPGVAAQRRDGDRRRGPRGLRDQARRAPGAVPGAARRPAGAAGAADRPVRDRPADRRDRQVPRRGRARRGRAAAQRQDHRGRGPGARRGHDRPR